MPNSEIRVRVQILSGRVAWAKQLTNKEAMKYTSQNIFKESSNWYPYK